MTVQPLEPTIATFQNPLLRYVAATRPAFLTASLMACLLGLAIARHGGIALNPELAAITLLFALLSGVALAGLWLMLRSGMQLPYIGLAGLFIGWAYSAPPFRLSSRGLGELCVAAGFLLITAGTDFVQRKGYAAAPFVAGLSYALLAANLLYINQFPDRKADTAAGKLHWVARLEVQQARWGYVLIAALAYAWLLSMVVLGWLPMLALLAVLALPLSVKAARLLLQYAAQPQQLGNAIRLTIAAMLLHGALLSLGLILG